MKPLFRAFWSGFFLFFIFSSSSCFATGVQNNVWGLPVAEIHEFLKVKNYNFLETIPVSSYDKILLVDKSVPYYLGLHLSKAGRIEQALKFYTLAVKKSPEPWKSLSQYELTLTGTPEARLLWIESMLRDKKRNFTISELSDTALKEKREVLLFESGRFSELSEKPIEWILSRPLSPELALSAVKLIEEKVQLHGSESSGLTPLDMLSLNQDILCLRIRLAVFEKNYQQAWLFARSLLEDVQENRLSKELSRPLLTDIGLSALYGSINASADAALLQFISEHAFKIETESGKEVAHVFLFYASRLFQRGGTVIERKEKRDLFLTALQYAKTPREYDSSIWYWLEAGKNGRRNEILAELKDKAQIWKDPAWFSDILEPLIVTLVREKDWKSIIYLAEYVGPFAESEIKTRLDYLSARSGVLSVEETKAAYIRAWEGDHNEFYYRLLSAEALGYPLESAEKAVPRRKPIVAITTPTFNIDELTLMLDGYITWDLEDSLYAAVQKWTSVLPPETARLYAKKLSEKGCFADATRLVLSAVRPENISVTREDLEFLYPRPWLEEVRASVTETVSESLLYALIRSESYYQSSVVSRSGAVGLTQLMPTTAADIARKLKVSNYDLTDPKTNIEFGAFYLNELIGRLNGNNMHALFSYNAGITRVRTWLRDSPVSEPDLFLETLPYAETREYGRKVLAAAAVYGYLYNQKTTGQAVRDLF